VADWEAEFLANPKLGGSSSQPIMTGSDYLSRLQRYEFEKATTLTLSRGRCRVVAGTGCAYRNEALHEVARLADRPGPWTYDSAVEDYELTFRMRQLGWKCAMSPTVICYTGAMKTLKSLWAQRLKWEAGTDGDLLRFGINKLNYREWLSRGFLLLNVAFWVVWLALNGTEFIVGHGHVNWWWQVMSVFLVLTEYINVRQMRGHRWARDWKDTLLAVCLVHMAVYNVLAVAWGLASWWKVLSGQMGDLWAKQYRAEGMQQVEDMKVGIGS
jgi:cellulose synthase/poly-beta-1,6-N-acetylglucosamine synthase-like glycosyltransferase